LAAERAALNLLTHLCGVATKTKEFVNQIKPYKAKILDTRKTTPGLRLLEKYAVRIGGGFNHRFCLDEMILIKDNHLKVIGDKLWATGIKKAQEKFAGKYKIEIEVNNLRDLKKALKIKPDIIMLDNMSLKEIKKAVKLRNNLFIDPRLSPNLEVSGRVNIKNIRKFASTGVEMISIGELTHSVKSVDISLEIS